MHDYNISLLSLFTTLRFLTNTSFCKNHRCETGSLTHVILTLFRFRVRYPAGGSYIAILHYHTFFLNLPKLSPTLEVFKTIYSGTTTLRLLTNTF